MSDVALSAVSILVGIAVAALFFTLTSRDSRRILREVGLLLRGLEEAGLVKWNRDAHGQAIGISFEVELADSMTLTDHVTTTLTRGQEDLPEEDDSK